MTQLKSSPNLITKVPKEQRFKRVIVFGAGMSKAFGLPLAAGLLSACRAHAKVAALNMSLVDEFERAFYPAGDADVEDLLGMAEAASHYGSLRAETLRGNRWRSARVSEMIYQLRRAISAYFWQYQTPDLETRITLLVDFVKQLGDAGTAYITFNYDLLLESALEYAGIPYSYHMPAPSGGVVILKPHGSVNWYEVQPAMFSTRRLGVGAASIFVADVFDKRREVGNLAGLIIPPSPQKSVENEFLRKIWTSFSSLVTNAKAVAMIGYSMPLADRLARLVLRRAGAGFSNTSSVAVVNPEPEMEAHFRRLIDPRIHFFEERFETFASAFPARKQYFALR